MRWRMIDRINELVAWQSIAAIKVVSLEEYSLLKPFGRKGECPQSLLLEACVQSCRWLTIVSSNFSIIALPTGIHSFRLERAATAGDALAIKTVVMNQHERVLDAECSVFISDRLIGGGLIECQLEPLAEYLNPDHLRMLWREINGAA